MPGFDICNDPFWIKFCTNKVWSSFTEDCSIMYSWIGSSQVSNQALEVSWVDGHFLFVTVYYWDLKSISNSITALLAFMHHLSLYKFAYLGDMDNSSTAANDPIFYLHSAFLDYLWEHFRQTKQVMFVLCKCSENQKWISENFKIKSWRKTRKSQYLHFQLCSKREEDK